MGCLKTYISLLVFLLAFKLYSQSFKVTFPESKNDKELEQELENTFKQKPAALKAEVERVLQNRGYWLYTLNISTTSDSTELYSIETNTRINNYKLNSPLPNSINIPELKSSKEALSTQTLNKITEHYLSFLENNGYPFASLKFDNYQIRSNTLIGDLNINKGPYISFDSITIKGFNEFPEEILKYDLGYFKGRPYSEVFLKNLEARIQQVEYLSFSRPPAIAFFKNKATLFLYVNDQKSNQIDGIIGLNTEANGQSTFNGDFKLRLLNQFKNGEEIYLRWRRPDESVQELNFAFDIPYLFHSPFLLNAGIDIFRQDSTFVNTETQTYLKYLISRGSFIAGGFNYLSSTLISDDANFNTNAYGSFKSYKYSLGAEINRTNRLLIPTSGYQFIAYATSGNRNTSDQKMEQYAWRLELDHFWNFLKNMVLYSSLSTKALFGDNLFENELYRIGGLKSLRGFNEQSIFSSAYGIGSLEYRYMIGEFDYLTLFSDLAYTEKKTASANSYDWLTGLGTGINFRTNSGIFSLFLAVGKSQATNFDLRATKVHFGYVNRF